SEFGDKLGLAFQIRDDILDVVGDEKLLGKPVNSDIDNEKTTFVSTYGIEKCKEKCNTLTEQCIDILSSICKDTNNLKCITKKLLSRKY
ncbi:MAG: polyprenyl synthetase family protein, partial [Clostridium sp.]|nr:polyprenyl synthetase family protein [Clostridium sp.]